MYFAESEKSHLCLLFFFHPSFASSFFLFFEARLGTCKKENEWKEETNQKVRMD